MIVWKDMKLSPSPTCYLQKKREEMKTKYIIHPWSYRPNLAVIQGYLMDTFDISTNKSIICWLAGLSCLTSAVFLCIFLSINLFSLSPTSPLLCLRAKCRVNQLSALTAAEKHTRTDKARTEGCDFICFQDAFIATIQLYSSVADRTT